MKQVCKQLAYPYLIEPDRTVKIRINVIILLNDAAQK